MKRTGDNSKYWPPESGGTPEIASTLVLLRRWPMLFPLLLAITSFKAAPNDEFRGTWLFQACKGSIRGMDAPLTHKPAEDNDNFEDCISYIGGYLDGVQMAGGCQAAPASMGTLARVYVAYMEKNPKMLDQFRGIGLRNALRDSYPCELVK